MKSEVKGDILYIFPYGRIDSTNAAQAENEIFELAEAPHQRIIIDADNLQYISSAGLRVILKLRKKEENLEIINASSEIYDVFDMTGFTEIIPVKKAYRKISVDGCEVIGSGANGKVYRLDPDTIIKVYMNSDSLPDIQRERELARKAFVLGIPTAIPYDVVKVGDSYGSVFELLNAKSLANLIKDDRVHIDQYVDCYIELLKKIHSTAVKNDDMPNMKDVAVDWAIFVKDYLPEETGTKLVQMMEAIPDVDHMMHGDYHIKNVMVQDDEVLLIDMDTLCYGHPIFELGSMFNAYCGFSEVDHNVTMNFLGLPYEVTTSIWQKALPMYLNTEDEAKIADVEKKAKIVGYTRLLRRAIRRNLSETEIGKKEIETYKNHLIDLVDEVDELTY